MGTNLEELLYEAKRLQYRKNPFRLIRDAKLKIKIKSGAYVPFQLNTIQHKLLDKIEQLWNEQKPIRVWVLKARQQGVSTLLEAIVYVLTALRENINSIIISDDIDGSNYLFDMSKLYHEETRLLDPFLVPETKRSNAKELVFQSTRSQIRIDTAKNILAGRKYTFQICHLSEIAFYDHPDILLDGLNQAVPELPYTLMIGETTANGVGGVFHEEWQKANNGESNWLPLFFGWYENAEYTRPFENEQEEIILRQTLGKSSSFNDPPGEENQLVSQYKCTFEQLNWRRFTIINKCRGNLDTFHQEYPAYPEQAFLVSGRPRFDAQKTKQIYEYTLQYETENPLQVGYLQQKEKNPEKIEFIPDTSGTWTIYENPKKDTEYSIFVDPAGGEEVEGTPEGKKGDFCVIEVFKRGDLFIQVAEYRSRIDPDLLADEACKAHLAYNKPKVGVEVNNMGRSTVDHLKHKADIYRREIQDEVTKKITKKLGWFTDRNTKKTMIDELASFIRDDLIIIRSKTLASECMTYVIGADGSTNAQGGCFDDCVMSTAGCLQMHLRTPKKSAYKVIEMRHGK